VTTSFDPVTARLVLALARDGSIGRAARHENIAPSAVSRRIADLEARLGVVLFDRSAQGVRPTPAGTAYAEACRRIMRQIADLEVAMQAYGLGEQGRLRLACTSSALGGRLPELLARYAAAHPSVALEVNEMWAAACLAAVEDARADLAFVADYNDLSRFAVEPFESDRVWVIAPAEHPLAARLAGGRPIPFAEATSHEVVGVHETGSLDRLLEDEAGKLGRQLGKRIKVESFASLARMVEAGFGIGFLRATAIHLIAGTDVVGAPLADSWAQRRLVVARRPDAPLAAATRQLLELARASLPAELRPG
jgi:DNA-binding transcriptional LysR family regulator